MPQARKVTEGIESRALWEEIDQQKLLFDAADVLHIATLTPCQQQPTGVVRVRTAGSDP